MKLGELIRHALAEIFTRGEIVDDAVHRYSLTVPEVRMTPHLKLATVFVLPLGGGGVDDVVKHLEQHKRFLRRPACAARQPEVRSSGIEFEADAPRKLAAQEALMLLEMLDHVVNALAAEGEHEHGCKLQIRLIRTSGTVSE